MPTSTIPFVPMVTDLSLSGFLWWVLLGVALIFLAHAAVASYHWLTYGSDRALSLLSIFIYVGVGGFILTAMLITLAII